MRNLLVLSLTLGLAACCSSVKTNKSQVKIGKSLDARQYSNIYFSGQPSSEDFKALKDDDFVLVVNLRDPSEHNEAQEKTQVTQAGMKYVNVPFGPTSTLDDKFINRVTAEVMKYRKSGKILVHCTSGNRAGIWAGGHFYKDHGYSKEKALEIAKELGVTNAGALTKVQAYLDTK